MAQSEKGPRDYLVLPGEFGKNPTGAWQPFFEYQRPKVGAAYYQHLVVCQARLLIEKKYGSVGSFAVTEDLPDAQGIAKKLNGSRRAQMDDYLIWALHLGRRILIRWSRKDPRIMLFPDHLVTPRESVER